MEYKVQVEDNFYTVKIKDMSSQKEQAETAEDIAYSAFLSEYDHCVQRSEKLDNKVYILLTVCAFLFVLLTSVISEAGKFEFPEGGLALGLIITYAVLLVADVGIYVLMLIKLVGLLKSVSFARFNTREILTGNLISETPATISRYIGTKYVRCINHNNSIIEERYKKFNFCVELMVADVVLSIILAFICTFISLSGGIKL